MCAKSKLARSQKIPTFFLQVVPIYLIEKVEFSYQWTEIHFNSSDIHFLILRCAQWLYF